MEQTKTALHLSDLSLTELDQVLRTYPWFSLARREFFLRMTSMGEEYKGEGLKKAAVYVFSREGLLKEGQKVKEDVLKKENEEKPAEFSFNMLEDDFNIQEKEKENTLEPVDFSEDEAPEIKPIKLESASEPAFEPLKIAGREIVVEKGDDGSSESPIEVRKQEVEIEPKAVKKKPEAKKEIHIVGGDYFNREDLDSLKEDGLTTIERFHTIGKTPEIPAREILEEEDDFTDEEYYTETLAKVYANQGFYQKAYEVYEKLILLYPEKSSYFAALKEDIKKYL